MREIIVTVEVSLDGVQDHPENFAFDYHDEESTAYLGGFYTSADAWLMGRETYEGMAAFWPTADFPQAAELNAMTKYVASRTLTEPLAWNNAHLLGPDPIARLAELKKEDGRPFVQSGVGELTRSMLDAGLVDELRLLVYPVVMGEGATWTQSAGARKFTLADSRTFSKGIVLMRLRPA